MSSFENIKQRHEGEGKQGKNTLEWERHKHDSEQVVGGGEAATSILEVPHSPPVETMVAISGLRAGCEDHD